MLGCLTEGGQGLATANNGKYIAIRRSSKWAANVVKSRPEKLVEAIKQHPAIINEFLQGQPADVFTKYSSEQEIIDTFDAIKDKYGRDVFGQGYIFRLIDDAEIADVDSLTEDEMQNGIDTSKPYYVPYDKGDKDGNRWYLETPFAIAWSKENVRFLKTDPKARFQGSTFFFKEGFCWIFTLNENSEYQKARYKAKTVNDVNAMALYTLQGSPLSIKYLVTLFNSYFIFWYKRAFINSTAAFQINDARLIPVVIPTMEQLNELEQVFDNAVRTKRKFEDCIITEEQANTFFAEQQNLIDKIVSQIYDV